MKFINRNSELNKLSDLWNMQASQLVVLYGKRRVGKTELIKQFIKDKRGIYFLADKRTHKDQLSEFARVVGNFFDDEYILKSGFSDWLEAFLYLKSKARKEKFVLAIDEYPYLVESDGATSSLFQKGWDEHLKETNIFLIICGSSIAMMESELLAYKSPLYGRLTGKLNIEPMEFHSCRKFFPDKSFEEFLSFYCITGGMPAYMKQFANYNKAVDAIEDLCWDKQGLYHDEVNLMLKQELRTPQNYFAILKAIAWGKTRVSEIAMDSGLNAQLVNKYIDTLIRLQLIRREVGVTETKPHKSKRGIYVLTENFVRFWFQYVYAFSSDLEISNIRQVKKRFLQYSNILEAIAYEQIARKDLFQKESNLFAMDKVGRYWDKDIEIDGIGFNSETKQIVFMEAKWSNTQQDIRALNKLRQKAKLVNWNNGDRKEYFAIYSKSGFSKELLDLNKEKENLILVEQMNLL